MTMVVGTLQERTVPRDPLVIEWRAKNAERLRLRDEVKRLNRELRDLKRRMTTGICQHCGKEFERVRPTKLHCSQACNIAVYKGKNGARRSFDAIDILAHLPMLRLLMTPMSIRVLENLCAPNATLRSAADTADISHQRLSQIAGKASGLITAFKLAQAAQQDAQVTSERP